MEEDVMQVVDLEHLCWKCQFARFRWPPKEDVGVGREGEDMEMEEMEEGKEFDCGL